MFYFLMKFNKHFLGIDNDRGLLWLLFKFYETILGHVNFNTKKWPRSADYFYASTCIFFLFTMGFFYNVRTYTCMRYMKLVPYLLNYFRACSLHSLWLFPMRLLLRRLLMLYSKLTRHIFVEVYF